MGGRIDNQPWLETGDPKTSVTASTATAGPFSKYRELGKVYNAPDGTRWQKVLFAATLTQAAVASNVVYWSDASAATVDTDLTDSEGARNTVAGVLHADGTMPTAGQSAWVVQEGNGIVCNGTNVNFQAGGVIIPFTTVGLVSVIAAGTAPTSPGLGTVGTPVDRSGGAGTVAVDLNIPSRLY